MKKETLISTSFSQTGANGMIKLLKSKYGCVIVEPAKYDKERGMWIVKYIDKEINTKKI
jgi:predicted RNA-binding protein YlxR (DUF448 family)